MMIDIKKESRKILEIEPLSRCLRRALCLAQETQTRELDRWIRLELGGYLSCNSAMEEDSIVPEYRTVIGQHADIYGRIFLPPPDLSFVNETRLRNGVEELETLAATRDVVVIHDPDMCRLISEHLQVDVYSFRFSAVHLRGVLSIIHTELGIKLAQLTPLMVPETQLPAQHTDEILQVRPNFYGVGVDLRALWRRWGKSK